MTWLSVKMGTIKQQEEGLAQTKLTIHLTEHDTPDAAYKAHGFQPEESRTYLLFDSDSMDHFWYQEGKEAYHQVQNMCEALYKDVQWACWEIQRQEGKRVLVHQDDVKLERVIPLNGLEPHHEP